MKIDWTDDEIAQAQAMSAPPAQVFATAAVAADRHLKLAGLRELVDPAEPVARAGVRLVGGGLDRGARPPRVRRRRPAGRDGPVPQRGTPPARRGSADPMVDLDAMRRVDPDAVLLDGAGHNAH